jgi:hypothetical protein
LVRFSLSLKLMNPLASFRLQSADGSTYRVTVESHDTQNTSAVESKIHSMAGAPDPVISAQHHHRGKQGTFKQSYCGPGIETSVKIKGPPPPFLLGAEAVAVPAISAVPAVGYGAAVASAIPSYGYGYGTAPSVGYGYGAAVAPSVGYGYGAVAAPSVGYGYGVAPSVSNTGYGYGLAAATGVVPGFGYGGGYY